MSTYLKKDRNRLCSDSQPFCPLAAETLFQFCDENKPNGSLFSDEVASVQFVKHMILAFGMYAYRRNRLLYADLTILGPYLLSKILKQDYLDNNVIKCKCNSLHAKNFVNFETPHITVQEIVAIMENPKTADNCQVWPKIFVVPEKSTTFLLIDELYIAPEGIVSHRVYNEGNPHVKAELHVEDFQLQKKTSVETSQKNSMV